LSYSRKGPEFKDRHTIKMHFVTLQLYDSQHFPPLYLSTKFKSLQVVSLRLLYIQSSILKNQCWPNFPDSRSIELTMRLSDMKSGNQITTYNYTEKSHEKSTIPKQGEIIKAGMDYLGMIVGNSNRAQNSY